MFKQTYTFYEDPGHGWLAVDRKELVRLGIADKITPYSYQKGEIVYLEEDCDYATFFEAKEKAGEKFEVNRVYQDPCGIRNYSSYHGQRGYRFG